MFFAARTVFFQLERTRAIIDLRRQADPLEGHTRAPRGTFVRQCDD